MRLNVKSVVIIVFALFAAVSLSSGLAAQTPPDSAKTSTPPAKTKSSGTTSKKSGMKSSTAGKGSAETSQGTRGKVVAPENANAEPPGKLHMLDQIVEIIKASNLYYSVETLVVIPPGEYLGDTARPLIAPTQYVKMVDGQPSLTRFKLSNMGIPLMGMADGAFKDKDYATALQRYRQLTVSDPSYLPLFSYIGETYMMMDSLDSAIVYLTQAVQKNPIDFDAHRMLADCYWRLGQKPEAIKELTYAHVLNINDKKIVGQLEEWRLLSGRNWDPRPVIPKYRIVKQADTVFVKAPLDWIGHAMVRAVWKYEPGYAKKMLGYDPSGSVYVMMEEREAMVGAMTTNKHIGFLNPVIEQGYLDEFILYEIVGPKHPMNIVVLPQPVIDRLVEYVEKFH